MTSPDWRPLLAAFLISCLVLPLHAADWKHLSDSDAHTTSADLSYVYRTIQRTSDGDRVSLQLIFFTSPTYEIKVVDQGNGAMPAYPGLGAAFSRNGCVAGTNGGFFHPDYRPAGLMITDSGRVNKFEGGSLLSGVLYCDAKGIYLTRRAAFKDDKKITALIQSGPYLIDGGASTRGLSTSPSRRRTFVCTDWRGNWAIGITSSISLATLGDLLADPDVIKEWKVNRALNLDGGSSTGLYYDRGPSQTDVVVPNWKRVRNLIGIAPR